MSKTILFVGTRPFWPTSTGKEIVLHHNCKGLHEVYGYDIYFTCFDNKTRDKTKEPPAFLQDVLYLNNPPMLKKIPTILCKSFLFDKWPLQASMFYDKTIAKQIQEYYNFVKPDILIIDMVRLVPYFDSLVHENIPKILIEDDFLAKRYERQIKANGNGNITGYLSGAMPNIFNKLSNLNFFKNFILRVEINRLMKYESNLPEKFDYITFISSIETREYNRQYKTNKAITLTMGADVQYYVGGTPDTHKEKSLSIVGNFTYAPNAASLEWISNEILTQLPPDITYYVIGKCPDELRNKIDESKLKILGFVDDIRSVVKSTDIYFSPIAYGTGIKTKVVEAMAMGMVVVTNSVGAEGLDVTSGQELFIADTPSEMVSLIETLLENDALCQEVGKRGQDFVRRHHDWSVVYDTFAVMGL